MFGTIATSTEPVGETRPREGLEYVLAGRKGHTVRLAAAATAPRIVTAITLDIPQDDWTLPGHISGFTRMAQPQVVVPPSFLQQRAAEEARRIVEELVPVPNHQLCRYCRELARPFVLMARPGRRDEGFNSGAIAQRMRVYKSWEKGIIDGLKADQNKSIVLLELGCERKPDVARAYSEKTYKLLKTSKCVFVRISEEVLDTKTPQGPAGDNPNQISILGDPTTVLLALDRAVAERMRKLTK